ncbi:MAG TPA: Tm-1-like ATP-binding domain-containing protein, partial [Gemmataceae bacterium]|nr:Tm-1-like ATP-binding domain-containing protein [Gemmataceae bacterium]
MAVLLIGTLDTKGSEYQFVRDLLNQAGIETLVLDAGVLNPPVFPADIGRDQVYTAAGTTIAEVQKSADRGKAIEAAARGAAHIALDSHTQDKVDGILALGGSAGTTIATAAMRALP